METHMTRAWDRCTAILAAVLVVPTWAQGDDTRQDDVRDMLQKLNDRIEALERQHNDDQQRIQALEEQLQRMQSTEADHFAEVQDHLRASAGQPASAPPGEQPSQPGGAEAELEGLLVTGSTQATPAARPASPLGLGSGSGGVQSFNPDISLNGDFLATNSNREGGETDDEFLFRELEIGFAGAIDPYTRADVIVTIENDDGDFTTDLEEAYVTFLRLPYQLQARVGRFRAEFGRANPTHLHALPWIDYPFVIQDYFGDEGLIGTGAELSWLIPNPWNEYMSLTLEAFDNDNDTLFAGDESDDFTYLLRFKTSHDFSAASTLDYGASIATAPTDSGHGGHRATIGGVDLTYHWKPKEKGLYRSFLWQSEVMAADRETAGGSESSWGMYSAAEYQFARRWKFGLRYDYAELPDDSSEHERGYSAYLTFLQSEFLYWRLGYVYTDRNFEEDGNWNEQQIGLQLNWTLGAHPAHKF